MHFVVQICVNCDSVMKLRALSCHLYVLKKTVKVINAEIVVEFIHTLETHNDIMYNNVLQDICKTYNLQFHLKNKL